MAVIRTAGYHHLKRQRKAAQPGGFQHSDSCKGQSSGNAHQAEAVTAVGDFDGNINAVAQKKKQQILLRFIRFSPILIENLFSYSQYLCLFSFYPLAFFLFHVTILSCFEKKVFE